MRDSAKISSNRVHIIQGKIAQCTEVQKKEDFLRFLPDGLERPFSNRNLAERARCSIYAVRQMTYCLKKMGAIEQVEKKGNELFFQVAK